MNRSLLKISAIASAGILLFACGEKKPKAPDPSTVPVQVNVYEARMEMPRYFDKYPGTVVATQQVDIRSVVEGYVTGIFFKEGDHVTKGQKLYSIDDSKFMASYNSAKAAVRVAESNVDQYQKDADRYIYLNQHEAVAKQILDHALTTLQNAKNQVTSAKQDLAKAKTDLDYSTIRAPFDGVIGISQVKLGNTVTVGQTILNTISSDGPVYVDIIVNEKQIPRFSGLLQHHPPATDSIFTLALADNSMYAYPGQLSLIDRGVNPLTGSITVRLSFPNPSMMLRAGMSGMVRVKNNDTTRQIMIPGKAIVEQMGEYSVFIAKDTAIGNADTTKRKEPPVAGLHAIQKKVQLGQVVGDRTVVRAGLKEGDKVVVDGVQKLHGGSLITTDNPQAPPAEKK